MGNSQELNRQLALCEKDKKELEQRVEELTDFFENASMPLHWVNDEGIIIWANKAELDSLGYTREEYIGQPISRFHVNPDRINDILNRLKNNETLIDYPSELRCKDGTIRHVVINSNALRKEGKFIHTRCFTKDITKLKEEEERKAALLRDLEQSETRLRMAIEAVQLGTWDYSPVSGELIWSDECRKIYGLPPGQQIDLEFFFKHIYPDDKDQVVQRMQRALDPRGNCLFDFTFRVVRFDNNDLRWVRSQGKVFFNSGQAERIVGTVLDINDSKVAEERSAKLAAIVESSDDAIISKTLEGIITSWNKAAERMFGYRADEIIGKSILTLIPEDRHHEEAIILFRLKRGERIEHFETKRITKNRRLLDISLTISPIRDSTGKIIGVSKIARDITDKKREESRKNDFIAMVSHELKTPLTSIKSYVQLLLERAKKENDSFRLNALTRTEIQIRKMVSMIGDFLSLARLEEGKIKLNKEVFNLQPLFDEIVNDARHLTSIHTITLNECDVAIYADKDKIGQVLVNLLSNAIKYSPNGGNITIGCEKIDGQAKIYVSDEGVGISEEDQKKLFDRFYRVENERLKTISGFGVGLYLVAEILKYHNTRIEVKSKEGEGSTFFFYLDRE